MAPNHEKTPLQSKKFVAFLVSDLTFKALAVFVLVWAWNLDEISVKVFGLLMAIIVITGFVAVGYLLGTASLDKYVRLAQIAIEGTKNGSKPNGSLSRVLSKGTKGLVEASAVDDSTEPQDEGD
jgi:hypothetical protein